MKSDLWTGTGRNQKDVQLIFLPCCWELRLAASPVTLKAVNPGSWDHARTWPQRSKMDPVSHLGLTACLPHSPLEAHYCLHWHTFCIHRGLFGWRPHTPRMLLRDEARHGARCSRKPEKGFSSLWGWEGRMLIPTRSQKRESQVDIIKKKKEKKSWKNALDIWGKGRCSDGFYLRHICPG